MIAEREGEKESDSREREKAFVAFINHYAHVDAFSEYIGGLPLKD